MREVFVLLAYLLMTLVKLCRPRGLYAVVAESLAVKHQLQSHESVPAPCAKVDAVGSFGLWAVRVVHSDEAMCEMRRHSQTFELHPVSPSTRALQIPMAVCFWKTPSPRSQEDKSSIYPQSIPVNGKPSCFAPP